MDVASPPPLAAVAAAVLLVFVLAPLIVLGNALVLTAVYRFKRLRTPSNYLLAALAGSDLALGLFLPVGKGLFFFYTHLNTYIKYT